MKHTKSVVLEPLALGVWMVCTSLSALLIGNKKVDHLHLVLVNIPPPHTHTPSALLLKSYNIARICLRNHHCKRILGWDSILCSLVLRYSVNTSVVPIPKEVHISRALIEREGNWSLHLATLDPWVWDSSWLWGISSMLLLHCILFFPPVLNYRFASFDIWGPMSLL